MRLRTISVALVAVMAGAGCGSSVSVSLPPDSAGPEVALTTYLGALVAGDCPTARALATAENISGEGVWCARPRVTAFSTPGNAARPTDSEVVYVIQIAIVGGDESLPDGPHFWFYDLRRMPGGAWRVNGGGSGP